MARVFLSRLNRAPLAFPWLIFAVVGCSSVHWGTDIPCGVPAASTQRISATPPGSSQVHVISWNLHGTPEVAPLVSRLQRVADQILLRKPDLVLVQELWFEGDARSLESLLSPDYSRVEDSWAVDLHALSPLSGLRRGGLLAFVRQDANGWRASRSEFARYHNAPPWYYRPVDEGDGLAAKGIQYFWLHQSGARLVVFNTHLQSQYREHDNSRYAGVRVAQVAQLQELARTFDREVPLLIAGDFNTSPDEKEIYLLITTSWRENAFWHDLTARFRTENSGVGTHFDQDGRATEWIDYVLVRAPHEMKIEGDLELIKSSGIDCPYSDHHGLDVLVSIRAK